MFMARVHARTYAQRIHRTAKPQVKGVSDAPIRWWCTWELSFSFFFETGLYEARFSLSNQRIQQARQAID